MPFTLRDALPLLRCPQSGLTLRLDGPLRIDGPGLVTAQGHRYPIVDDIVDLCVDDGAQDHLHGQYDAIAGARYNLWIFNPLTMAFTWGLGVLKIPMRMRPSQELRPGTLLEVPCGTGIFTSRAYRDNPATRVLAVDHSMGMLRAARDRARKLGVDNAVFIRADVARLPIADGSIDACLSMAGFHAFPDPSAAAREIGRALRPGGSLSTTIACSGERWVSDMMIERVMKPRGFFSNGLPAETYRRYLRDAGFDDLRVHMAGAVMLARGRRS